MRESGCTIHAPSLAATLGAKTYPGWGNLHTVPSGLSLTRPGPLADVGVGWDRTA